MVEAISKDLSIETATRMDNVSAGLLLSHNPSTAKLFKMLYLNQAQVSLARIEFGPQIVQVERCRDLPI